MKKYTVHITPDASVVITADTYDIVDGMLKFKVFDGSPIVRPLASEVAIFKQWAYIEIR